MDIARISVGLAAWFLGIVVPAMHHALLHLPLAMRPSSNDVVRMASVYKGIHWSEWLYLAVMAAVGGILVFSGLFNGPVKRAA